MGTGGSDADEIFKTGVLASCLHSTLMTICRRMYSVAAGVLCGVELTGRVPAIRQEIELRERFRLVK